MTMFAFAKSTPILWAVASDGLLEELYALARLPAGWFFGKGEPPDYDTLNRAAELVGALQGRGVEKFEFSPDQSGAVMISAYRENKCLEFICHIDGKFDIFEETDSEEVRREHATFREVLEYIQGLSWHPRSSSYFSIQCTTATKKEDTIGWPSKTQREAEFLSSTWNVLMQPTNQFALTSQNTIQLEYPDRLRRTG